MKSSAGRASKLGFQDSSVDWKPSAKLGICTFCHPKHIESFKEDDELETLSDIDDSSKFRQAVVMENGILQLTLAKPQGHIISSPIYIGGKIPCSIL